MDASEHKLEADTSAGGEGADGSQTRLERLVALRNDPDREARWSAWRAENAAAIASWNDYVEEHGLPLARYRTF